MRLPRLKSNSWIMEMIQPKLTFYCYSKVISTTRIQPPHWSRTSLWTKGNRSKPRAPGRFIVLCHGLFPIFMPYNVGPARQLSWLVTPVTMVCDTSNNLLTIELTGFINQLTTGGPPHCKDPCWPQRTHALPKETSARKRIVVDYRKGPKARWWLTPCRSVNRKPFAGFHSHGGSPEWLVYNGKSH